MSNLAKHPAPFSPPIMVEIDILLRKYGLVSMDHLILDPFAGIGTIHQLRMKYLCQTFGVELEHEWAVQNSPTIVADATQLPFRDSTFHAVVTSPTYSNRMADSHNAQDGSYRRSYTHTLGRKLHSHNSGKMQWGDEYRRIHLDAWDEIYRVLRRYGTFILNISNHIRNYEEMRVAEWHLKVLLSMDFFLRDVVKVETQRHRRGENYDARTGHEFLFVLQKG